MCRLLLACLILLCVSCHSAKPPPDPHVWHVSPRSLYTSYVDDSERYTDRHVAVVLSQDSYTVSGKELRWYSTFKKNGPDIVFLCHGPTAEGSPAVNIRGICRGCTRDWFGKVTVRVEDCTFTPAQ